MGPGKLPVYALRAGGLLLGVLGLVHLIATPHLPELLEGSPDAVYRRAIGPTLLNHVLVGVLLLPLGYTTWLAAEPAARRERWARKVLVVNVVAVSAMPALLLVFMRRAEYYRAPLFLLAVASLAMIVIVMAIAVLALARSRGRAPVR